MILPIITKPIFKTAVWAGTKLSKMYGIDFPVSEAWMLTVREKDMSEVINPPYAGKKINEIAEFDDKIKEFPLLVKLIDAEAPLSVQVHPDDEYAHSKGEPYGKTEMWYILEAEEGAQLVYGLKEGTDKEKMEKALRGGTASEVLNYVDVKAGESYFIPAGMVHAIGKGILIAEIQQNSDTTYRLYDYDRVDKDGNKRPLHIEDAVKCTKTDICGAERFEAPVIADCEFFKTEKLHCEGTMQFSEKELCHILVIEGEGEITYGSYAFPLEKYSSVTALEGCCEFKINGNVTLLKTVVKHS
ncbi:MAG: class I mannose-6-phosphate isomerase [Clostridia bacterium]|nr:class I mannose-6-phosphate isomerase [Clostridia bacterium]